MSKLCLIEAGQELTDRAKIKEFLQKRSIFFDFWPIESPLNSDADEDEVLETYREHLDPYMKEHSYQSADVVCISNSTPNIKEIRDKFLKEHTHNEDEIRIFVAGEGLFWFHIQEEVFSVLCTAGDIISVPAGEKHWFDIGNDP